MEADPRRLSSVVAARLREWRSIDLPVEREVFGTGDPDALVAAVDSWCRAHLGAAIDYYVFFESSIGSVHGVMLRDGRGAVVKGHRAAERRAFLDAVHRVQSALASGGYPAPRPLVAPTPCGSGHVTAEELLQLSSRPDGHDPAVRRELARGLVQFVQRARPFAAAFADVPYVFDVPAGGVYAVPQSTRFDFDATTAGAEWIDALAEEARARLRDDSGERVVVHGDWRIENVGFRDGRLAAVFDWDSVHVAREVEAVATAATTFCVDWRRPPGNSFPRPSEIAAFLHDYETARGAAFSADECHLLAAAMVASLAYGARCEHADRSRPVERDSQRGLLQELGALLLDEGLAVLGF